jgi:NAD(P)-dependent dehydrogenase (short-subunit alcohol dehydrogenase family)
VIPRRERTALVTGGNRGIGLATCRALAESGLEVVLSSRRRADAESAAAELSTNGFEVRPEELDLASEGSVRDCAARLAEARIEIDVLVNNGAVLHEGDVLSTSSDDFRRAFDVNVLGALWCCRAFVPGMLERGYGRVVNVSSGWGAFAEGLSGPASYSVTKAALNALTVTLARSLRGDVKVNACCPGWVRTRMGGKGADRSPEDAAKDVVWLATLPKSGPSGGFFRERRRIEW